MSRASKGKVKHLWDLFGVWHIVAFRKTAIWFYEPTKAEHDIAEAWLVPNMYPTKVPV